jgi:hypothetical protein
MVGKKKLATNYGFRELFLKYWTMANISSENSFCRSCAEIIGNDCHNLYTCRFLDFSTNGKKLIPQYFATFPTNL